MSDDASPAPAKRGRKSNADKAAEKEKNEKVAETKKRGKDVKEAEDDGSPQVKRGRGRPKGTTKKKAAVKPKAKGTGRRGRPKKKEKDAKESPDEDNEDNDEGDEEDD